MRTYVATEHYEGYLDESGLVQRVDVRSALLTVGLDLLLISRVAEDPEHAGEARGLAHRYLEAAHDFGVSL